MCPATPTGELEQTTICDLVAYFPFSKTMIADGKSSGGPENAIDFCQDRLWVRQFMEDIVEQHDINAVGRKFAEACAKNRMDVLQTSLGSRTLHRFDGQRMNIESIHTTLCSNQPGRSKRKTAGATAEIQHRHAPS